jgi:SAM-dependent methyltransferase
MAQFTRGLYRLTQIPRFYKAIPYLLARRDALRGFAEDAVGPVAGRAVLDLGCGPGTMCPYLEGARYKGVDLNPDHVVAAREKFGHFEFHCSDAGSFLASTPAKYDVVLMIGLLHHLDDAQLVDVMRGCRKVLNANGRLITLDPTFEERQNPIAYLLARLDSGRNVRRPDQYLKLTQQVFPDASITVRRDLLRLPYSHAVMTCRT